MRWQQLFGYNGDDALFCIAADGSEILFADFKRDLARASQLLEKISCTEPLGRAALYCTDTYEFCVWLFAGLAAKLQLVIPSNNKRATSDALADIDIWLGEWPAADGRHLAFPLNDAESSAAARALPQDFTGELQLFTSGSSGEPQSIRKHLAQLMTEIAAQQQQWGPRVERSCVLATVSHQHIYGLLFRLLWPLADGRPFASKTYVDVAALLRDAQIQAPALWVASPAQLSRRNAAWPWQHARHLSAIFSSGGPLAVADAAAIADLSGHWPWEIYGSTETGGIAWRQQRGGNTWWTPLQGVRVSAQAADQLGPQLLQVQSPWVADGYATQDRVRIDGAQFELLGRVDQIAKIEEKRISLTQVERLLENTPLVARARVLVLPKGANRNRDLLGALVVLTGEGCGRLIHSGKSALVRQLRTMLAPDLDGVALPRSWRFVSAIPVNQQGKSPRELLMNAFEAETENPMATPTSMLPVVESVHKEPSENGAHESVLVTLRVPRSLPCLPGHFETAPVVPGVVQIDWAAHFGKSLLQVPGDFAGMENIKFKQLLVPQEQAQLQLIFDAEKQKLNFRFFWQDDEFSSGKLSFRHG